MMKDVIEKNEQKFLIELSKHELKALSALLWGMPDEGVWAALKYRIGNRGNWRQEENAQ